MCEELKIKRITYEELQKLLKQLPPNAKVFKGITNRCGKLDGIFKYVTIVIDDTEYYWCG